MLGWNIQYGFNDSDFEVSENLLSIYLDEYEETPWDALKYLVSLVLRDQSGLSFHSVLKMVSSRSAYSQHPNVCKSHSMECE